MNAATVVPLQVPSFSRFEAEQLNRIAAWRMPLQIPGYETFTLLRIERSEAQSNLGVDRLVIDWEFGTDKLIATMPRGLAFDLLGALEPDLNFDPFPSPDIAALVLEAVLAPLLERLERGTRRAIKITGVSPAVNSDIRSLGFSILIDRAAAVPAPMLRIPVYLSLRAPRLRQTLTLGGSASALDSLFSSWPVGFRPLDSLRLSVSFRAGVTLLSSRLVASLRIGDAVLLQDVFVPSPRNELSASVLRMVVAETLTTIVRATEDGWRLDTVPQREWKAGQTVADEAENNPSGATSAPSDLHVLPVRLVFEAARLELPLGELRRLGEGSLLQIDATPGIVRILANGHLIGTGELVSIEGRAGVRITAFSEGTSTLPRQSSFE
ncbi:FliM/FliN family flagellar motor switch protein [Bradyrhizobium sp. Tv2a-2]|uniref:FliM/FliN family flagellar motor switch protein n=1 Tax=Bradyrhizobium sp. Tv2a-2 TaxID=113395 RepID=UPI00041999B8|nr:FliM/FliN family flagellar motor switch protein [Bradyrhizobium sp. Tv2a-2]